MLRERNEKWIKTISEWYPRNGKRNKGRQAKRWEEDLKRTAVPEWRRMVRERDKWKSLEEAYDEGRARNRIREHQSLTAMGTEDAKRVTFLPYLSAAAPYRNTAGGANMNIIEASHDTASSSRGEDEGCVLAHEEGLVRRDPTHRRAVGEHRQTHCEKHVIVFKLKVKCKRRNNTSVSNDVSQRLDTYRSVLLTPPLMYKLPPSPRPKVRVRGPRCEHVGPGRVQESLTIAVAHAATTSGTGGLKSSPRRGAGPSRLDAKNSQGDSSTVKPLAPCVREGIKPPVRDVVVAQSAAVVSAHDPAPRRRRGLRFDCLAVPEMRFDSRTR
ncbi:hypothetical protein EVAR_12605_1 [Eumeta japonica]|uniref:Uncharacterized protein n=1 Tax=Eumeta variegata TaxID=151549 RepID=A0A4C1UEX6_EUMVA|nr:hypothetical protein EVAR_12605_1 [Eumeta japonica]